VVRRHGRPPPSRGPVLPTLVVSPRTGIGAMPSTPSVDVTDIGTRRFWGRIGLGTQRRPDVALKPVDEQPDRRGAPTRASPRHTLRNNPDRARQIARMGEPGASVRMALDQTKR